MSAGAANHGRDRPTRRTGGGGRGTADGGRSEIGGNVGGTCNHGQIRTSKSDGGRRRVNGDRRRQTLLTPSRQHSTSHPPAADQQDWRNLTRGARDFGHGSIPRSFDRK